MPKKTAVDNLILDPETGIKSIPLPRNSVLLFFYVLLTVHSCTALQINPTRCTILLSIFISLLYMFRAPVCPSSGEITVSMRHWYLWLCLGGIWSAGCSFTPNSTPDATHTEWQIPVSHRYSNFSWWWAHGCTKHAEKRNKYTEQNCAPIWIHLQECFINFYYLPV